MEGIKKNKNISSFQSLVNKSPPLYQVNNKKKLEIYLSNFSAAEWS